MCRGGPVMIPQDGSEANRNVHTDTISNRGPVLRADTALDCQGEPDIDL